ncbi:MAG: hypothetical protein ACRDLL_08855, partial [Solirubrobacterales bacterium]
IEAGEAARPDAALTERLRKEVASAGRAAVIASFDVHPAEQPPPEGAVAADMQSAALLGRANALGLEVAALLVVAEIAGQDERLEGEALELAEKLAGRAASSILSA